MILPPISRAVRVPPVVWRGDTGREPPDEATAADMVRHDATESGRVYDFSPDFLAYLGERPAAVLLWVTFRREDAERYAPAVFPLALDIPALVVAADDAGGFLLLLDYNTTMTGTGGFAMTDEQSPTDVEEYIRANGLSFRSAFGSLSEKDAQSPDLVEAQARYINYTKGAAVAGNEHAEAWLVRHGHSGKEPPDNDPSKLAQQQRLDPAPDEDEQKKKHGRGDGPGGPAGFSALAHNIRPDVESAPGGFVVVTTAKNSERDHIILDAPRPSVPQEDERPARIETASERLAARIARIEGRADDDGHAAELAAVQQRDAEDGTKRQEGERRERSGEPASDPAEQSSSARLAARIGRIESSNERDAEDVREALGLTQDGKPHGDTGRGL